MHEEENNKSFGCNNMHNDKHIIVLVIIMKMRIIIPAIWLAKKLGFIFVLANIVFVNMYSQTINEIVPSSFPTPLHLPRYHGHWAMPLTTGQRSHDHTTYILSHSFPWTIALSLP